MAKQKKRPRNIYFTDDQWKAVKAAADQDVSEVSPFVVRTVMSSIEPVKRRAQ